MTVCYVDGCHGQYTVYDGVYAECRVCGDKQQRNVVSL